MPVARPLLTAACRLAVGLALLGLAVLGLAACGGTSSNGQGQGGGGMMGGGASPGGGMMGGGASPGGTAGPGGMMGGAGGTYGSLGERIFLTGVGGNGQTIPHTAPAVAQGSLMMGGGGCASCHGRDGKGGTISMMTGASVTVPDITYPSLVKEGFTETTIGAAIRDGRDEAGKPLKDAMPRWQMGGGDLNAVIAYLKQLGAR